jgi:hypothetical protein
VSDREIHRPEADPHEVFLRLSAQRALLGAIGPNVVAVAVSYRGQQIVFQAWVDTNASPDQREDLDVAATEIIADFPPDWTLDVAITDGASDMPPAGLVYLRRETE